MTFKEWYDTNHNHNWEPEFKIMSGFRRDKEEYQDYCLKNKLEPIWDY
jgi:hypothetical protein